TLSRPSTEAILALSPDLVLLTEDIPAQKELKAELDGMGIKTMTIEINSFSDYLAVMSELTSLTGHPELYEKNGVQVDGRIEEIRAQAKEIADANAAARKTFLAMRVSATKNKVFKDDYFACEIFRDFGLINIAEDNSSLDDLSLEAIVAADPDYIFVIPQGKEDEAMESFKAQFEDNPVWSELSAVREGRMFIMPKDYFQYKPNAKWDLAYEYVLDLLKAA
ncbi:MAG: ABC transporter substrate-binding protein, partial [Lachnospiraceae bacterium]|nr:ABC transporter substrate-binding protein [Lachnospiraceae bacterium]